MLAGYAITTSQERLDPSAKAPSPVAGQPAGGSPNDRPRLSSGCSRRAPGSPAHESPRRSRRHRGLRHTDAVQEELRHGGGDRYPDRRARYATARAPHGQYEYVDAEPEHQQARDTEFRGDAEVLRCRGRKLAVVELSSCELGKPVPADAEDGLIGERLEGGPGGIEPATPR